MADRYFQCAMCKKLTAQDDTECYIMKDGSTDQKTWTAQSSKLENEICDCAGTKSRRRLRELTQPQYNMELALNRPVNQ